MTLRRYGEVIAMEEYITKSEAIEAVGNYFDNLKVARRYAKSILDNIPSADVVEREECEAKINEIILAHSDWKPIKRGKWKIKRTLDKISINPINLWGVFGVWR